MNPYRENQIIKEDNCIWTVHIYVEDAHYLRKFIPINWSVVAANAEEAEAHAYKTYESLGFNV